jgi:hypothetical protein
MRSSTWIEGVGICSFCTVHISSPSGPHWQDVIKVSVYLAERGRAVNSVSVNWPNIGICFGCTSYSGLAAGNAFSATISLSFN